MITKSLPAAFKIIFVLTYEYLQSDPILFFLSMKLPYARQGSNMFLIYSGSSKCFHSPFKTCKRSEVEYEQSDANNEVDDGTWRSR
jgi:hypothetical protein